MKLLDLELSATIHLVMIIAVVFSGVRQGESLSLFLFSMYFNDIDEWF